MVDCTGLENRHTARYPGFKSLSFRQYLFGQAGSAEGFNDSEIEAVRAHAEMGSSLPQGGEEPVGRLTAVEHQNVVGAEFVEEFEEPLALADVGSLALGGQSPLDHGQIEREAHGVDHRSDEWLAEPGQAQDRGIAGHHPQPVPERKTELRIDQGEEMLVEQPEGDSRHLLPDLGKGLRGDFSQRMRLRLATLALPQAAEVEIEGTFGQFETVSFVVEVAYLAIFPLHKPPHFGLFRFRVDQHVMGYAFRAVKIEFDNFIPAGSLGRDDFENQIRGAGQPFTFRLVADRQHVGSDDGVLRKFHIYFKHRLAVRAIVERFVKLPKYGGAYLLMIEARRREHCNRLAVNQLPITFPLQVILHRVGFDCWLHGHSLRTPFV